jgi:arylsulfatase
MLLIRSRSSQWPLLLVIGLAISCGGTEEGASPQAKAAAEQVESDTRPTLGNVILIVIDTLRADAVGAFAGIDRGTPVLDRLARDGVYFEQATSTSSYTRESMFSLFTGELSGPKGRGGWDSSPAGDSLTLPLRMRRLGRYTAMTSASMMVDLPGFRRGFDHVQFIGSSQNASQQSPAVSQSALAAVKAQPSRPFFLYVHYLDPHGPYDPPAGSVPEFDRFERVGIYDHVRENVTTLQSEGFGPGEPRFEDYRARYAAELRHVDSAIGQLLDGLREQGLLDNALVIVTSDHGEEFLEHGYVEHAWTLYEESIRVPLILHAPDWLEPARISHRVSGVDLSPTLDVLFGDTPEAGPGEPLLEWTPDGWSPRRREGPVHFELGVQTRLLVRGVAADGWKYLEARRWLAPAEREIAVRRKEIYFQPDSKEWVDPWGPVVRQELFELASDPAERRHRSDAPERLDQLRGLLEATRPAVPLEPRQRAPMSDAERERLEALGYL